MIEKVLRIITIFLLITGFVLLPFAVKRVVEKEINAVIDKRIEQLNKK